MHVLRNIKRCFLSSLASLLPLPAILPVSAAWSLVFHWCVTSVVSIKRCKSLVRHQFNCLSGCSPNRVCMLRLTLLGDFPFTERTCILPVLLYMITGGSKGTQQYHTVRETSRLFPVSDVSCCHAP